MYIIGSNLSVIELGCQLSNFVAYKQSIGGVHRDMKSYFRGSCMGNITWARETMMNVKKLTF